ncbi:hypothetical protein KEM48_006380 [Puccinia striiformis f. sp. tritici PST-130]|nr:hypothetical protein KEM48_006380 [Puccinia striiformis f. sp. tritici PST-130]
MGQRVALNPPARGCSAWDPAPPARIAGFIVSYARHDGRARNTHDIQAKAPQYIAAARPRKFGNAGLGIRPGGSQITTEGAIGRIRANWAVFEIADVHDHCIRGANSGIVQ